MSETDEPALRRPVPETAGGSQEFGARILDLVCREPFAILCTQGEGQPYGSVVAVAFTDDLAHALLATPVTTRKYRLLMSNARVALVVDDRAAWPKDMMRIEAVTATGSAHLIERGEDFDRWAAVLVERHPQLDAFLRADSSALFRVDVLRYFHVERFQEVREWIPPSC